MNTTEQSGTRALYHVYDRAGAMEGITTLDKAEAVQWLEDRLRQGLIVHMQETDDGMGWRDITDDEIEVLADEWLNTHFKYEWPDMPNWVWQSDAYYQREQRSA